MQHVMISEYMLYMYTYYITIMLYIILIIILENQVKLDSQCPYAETNFCSSGPNFLHIRQNLAHLRLALFP